MFWLVKSLGRRIIVYTLITIVIQATCVWLIFALAHEQPAPKWLFYVLYNVYMLVNPMLYGPTPTWFFALIIGTLFMFVIVSVVGEAINWLIRRKSQSNQCDGFVVDYNGLK
jgi:hypothetical protein